MTVSSSDDYVTDSSDTAAVLVKDVHKDPDDIYSINVSVTPNPIEFEKSLQITYTSDVDGPLFFNPAYRYMPSRHIRKQFFRLESIDEDGHFAQHSVIYGTSTDRFLAVYIDNIYSPENLGFGDRTLVIVPIRR